eukprot:1017345-Prorocentrum_minimum.AAC.1
MVETPGGCTPYRLAKESRPGPHPARDTATNGHDSNIYSTCSIAAWTKGCNLVDSSSSWLRALAAVHHSD